MREFPQPSHGGTQQRNSTTEQWAMEYVSPCVLRLRAAQTVCRPARLSGAGTGAVTRNKAHCRYVEVL